MNNRVKRILGYTQPMSKQANITDALRDTGKGGLLLVLAAAALAGAGAGWTAEKITTPVETDFDNARDSYAVGNLKANIMSNVNKLRAERMNVTDRKQKALRLI